MDFLGVLCRSVYQPILYKKWGLDISPWEKRSKDFESMDRDRLVECQKHFALELLRYSFTFVPYYKTLFNKMGVFNVENIEWDMFHSIPILTKEIVISHGANIISNDNSLKGVLKNMTGGSTGMPIAFYQDAGYRAAAIGTERCILNWWGIRAGDRVASLWGADREVKDWTFRERFLMRLNREKIFDSFAMTEEKMHEFAIALVKWRPKYIKGYSSSLHLFARFLLENRCYKINPLAIRATAETLFDIQRKDIEEAFSCKVYNFYGSREVNNLAAECSQQNGLHILSGSRIVEVLDAKNNPAPSGEIGRIVVTDLVNRAMPFIRYENGDLGIISEDNSCSCHLPYPRLERVIGRVSDILTGVNGQYVHGEFITHLFYEMHGIVSFQVIQHDKFNIELLIQLLPGKILPEMGLIYEKIRERLGNISINVNITKSFERNSSGKHRFIVSKISPFQK